MSITPTPLASLIVSRFHIAPFGGFPNTSLRPYPLYIYHSVFSPSSGAASSGTVSSSTQSQSSFAASVESHLRHVGVVDPAWRYSMYRAHHYHSTTDEVLVVISGSARLCFGGNGKSRKSGDEGTDGLNRNTVEVEVEVGDAIIIPAGVGHALLVDHHDAKTQDNGADARSGTRGAFQMIGSYPIAVGGQWDMCMGEKGDGERGWEEIRKLEWFQRDPIYGAVGPVLDDVQ